MIALLPEAHLKPNDVTFFYKYIMSVWKLTRWYRDEWAFEMTFRNTFGDFMIYSSHMVVG